MRINNMNLEEAYNLFKATLKEANVKGFKEVMLNNRTKVSISDRTTNKDAELRAQHIYFNKLLEVCIPEKLLHLIPLYGGNFSKTSMVKYITTLGNIFSSVVLEKLDIEEILYSLDNATAEYKKLHPDIVGEPSSMVEMYRILKESDDVKPVYKDIHNFLIQNVQLAFSVYSHIVDLHTTVLFNGVFIFEEIARIDKKCEEIIRHGGFTSDMNVFQILERRNEDGMYLQNKIIEHGIEPIKSMIEAETGIRYEQFLDSVVGLGIKPFDNTGDSKHLHRNRLVGSFMYPHLLANSYLRGLSTKEEQFLTVANGISSVVLAKRKMGDAGYTSKLYKLVSKTAKIHMDPEHECDSKYRRQILIKDIATVLRMEGMYYTDENWVDHQIDVNKPEQYIGKTLNLRTAAHCNNIQYGGICRKCMGDLLYYENRTMAMSGNQGNAGLVFAAWISGPAQQSILSAKHNQSANPLLPSYFIKNNDRLYKFYDNIEVKYDYINHVFFNVDGEDILPDSITFIDEKVNLLPWSNTEVITSNDIKIEVDGNTYFIHSDTLFYVEKDTPKEHYVAKLKHLFKNIGVGHLFNSLQELTNKAEYKNDLKAFFDHVDQIKPDYHLNFMYTILSSVIRTEDDKIPDFGVPNQTLKVLSVIEAIKKSPFVNTLSLGFLQNVMGYMENYNIRDRYHVDTDNTLR